MRRPAGCNSDDAAMARVGVPTRSGALCAAPSPGAAAEPVAALAMAGRTQDRCRGECRVMGTEDTADHRGRLGIDCAVSNREITNRDGTGRGGDGWPRRVAGGGADRLAAKAMAERVPWPAVPIAFGGPGGPP
jgi:hypothetical protein